MRFTALLLACVLAATAAHSHDAVDLPELPIPAIDQLFPVDDLDAAHRWAGRTTSYGDSIIPGWSNSPNRWHVVALSGSQFRQVNELLAGIQQTQKMVGHWQWQINDLTGRRELVRVPSPVYGFCTDSLDGRFSVYLQGWNRGGVDNEFLWTSGFGYGYRGGVVHGFTGHLLKNRFSVVGGVWDWDTELRDTGFSMQFRFVLVDNAVCAAEHTSHSNGSPRHDRTRHRDIVNDKLGPITDWIPIADLLDGGIALRAELRALRGDLAAVRDSVAWLSSRSNTGGDTTAVRPSSWGQIKALIQQGE